MKVYAHRGYSGKYPENTMLAFSRAYQAGCDGIELDVQLTKDEQVVIIHDEKIDRTTNGEGYVRDFTLDELQRFNANATHPESCQFERIPTLDEYLSWAKHTGLITNIEIKSGVYYYKGLEDKTVELVRKHRLQDKVIFSSFNHLSALKIKALAPEIQCGLLTENGGIANAGAYCRDFGFQFYHPDKKDLDEENIKSCKDNGIRLNVWTVDDFFHLQKLHDLGCYGIITNFPEVPINWLKGLGER